MRTFLKRALIGCGMLAAMTLGQLYTLPVAYAGSSSTDAAKQSSCQGIGGTVNAEGKCTVPGSASLSEIIANVINLISVLVGVVAVIMIVVGGLKYVTANGDASKAKSASMTILYAVIGLVVVAMAQAIVRLVINKTA